MCPSLDLAAFVNSPIMMSYVSSQTVVYTHRYMYTVARSQAIGIRNRHWSRKTVEGARRSSRAWLLLTPREPLPRGTTAVQHQVSSDAMLRRTEMPGTWFLSRGMVPKPWPRGSQCWGLHVILLQSAEHFTKSSCHVLVARQVPSA